MSVSGFCVDMEKDHGSKYKVDDKKWAEDIYEFYKQIYKNEIDENIFELQ